MPDEKLLHAISELVANALNSDSLAGVPRGLVPLFPADMGEKARQEALDQALVYALQAHQPGYPPAGAPGYIPSSASLKEAVLHEVEVMDKVDEDGDVDAEGWEKLVASLRAASESDFARGADINCPDDWLLVLRPVSCGLLLRQKGVQIP